MRGTVPGSTPISTLQAGLPGAETASRTRRTTRRRKRELVASPAEVRKSRAGPVQDCGHLARSLLPEDFKGLGDINIRPQDCQAGSYFRGAHPIMRLNVTTGSRQGLFRSDEDEPLKERTIPESQGQRRG
jgi:hypothetical protein